MGKQAEKDGVVLCEERALRSPSFVCKSILSHPTLPLSTFSQMEGGSKGKDGKSKIYISEFVNTKIYNCCNILNMSGNTNFEKKI